MLNLVLAAIWLLVGIGMILWNYLYPDQPVRPIRGTSFSPGWLVLILAAYNLVRWWSGRSYRRERRAAQEAYLQRQRDYRREHPEPPREPDPNFDFSKPSPTDSQERPPQ